MSLDSSKPAAIQAWIDKYHAAPKYLETTPKWPDCVTYWKMEVGSTHRVQLFSKEIIGVFPLSGFRIVMQASDVQTTYLELLTNLKAMYSAVRSSDLVIERDFSTNQYAVAWIEAKKQFFRVRLSDDDGGSNVHRPVFTLDSGQRTVVTKDDLFPICEEFMDVRPMVTTVELEGLIPFDFSEHLGEIMREFDWTCGLLDFLVTRVWKERPCGTLRVPGDESSINSMMLKLLYAEMKAPQLPHSGHSLLDGVIVHAEDDANVFLQLNLPSTRALRHYCDQAKSIYDSYVLRDCVELEKRKVKVPTEALGKILLLVDKGKVLRVAVEDTDNGSWLESDLHTTQAIKLRAIDTGKPYYAKWDNLFQASQLFYLLELVPPQCVRVKLAGISKLNSDKFMSTYTAQGPPKAIIIKIVQSAREDHPAEVLLFQSRISEAQLETFVNINEEAIGLGIGTAPSGGPTKSCAVIHSPTQIQHIEMRDFSAWMTDKNAKQLNSGDGIVFRVAKINDGGECTIQSLNGNAVTATISRKIREAVERPWWQSHLLKERKKKFVKGWFYPYYSEEKGLFLRARLIKTLRDNKMKILLVDYAEYAEVDRAYLMPAIPFSVCGIGPQAAIVQGLDISRLESIKPRNIPKLENTTYQGRIKEIDFDHGGLTIFTFSSVQVCSDKSQ